MESQKTEGENTYDTKQKNLARADRKRFGAGGVRGDADRYHVCVVHGQCDKRT